MHMKNADVPPKGRWWYLRTAKLKSPQFLVVCFKWLWNVILLRLSCRVFLPDCSWPGLWWRTLISLVPAESIGVHPMHAQNWIWPGSPAGPAAVRLWHGGSYTDVIQHRCLIVGRHAGVLVPQEHKTVTGTFNLVVDMCVQAEHITSTSFIA